MDQLNNTLQHNRSRLTPMAPIQVALPVQYPQNGPRPVGAPAVLNSEVLAGSLRATTNSQDRQLVPYNVLRPNQPAAPNPLSGFQRYKWCITCGYRKSHHEPSERFGRPCQKAWCGKCYQRKEFHQEGKMGPLCPFPPHPRESQQHLWYT